MQLRDTLYSPDATIVLIGMRGVGKTSLGLIASTTLRRSFFDCDSVFQTKHGVQIAQYVVTNGWDAFRTAETIILKKLLQDHPKGAVIACGGGVVEREENRNLLREFRMAGAPIVLVTRDKEETLRVLVDEATRPSWGEEIRAVWNRRTPHFESLSTHVIVSLTANPPPSCPTFAMKHVETAFVRLLRSIFGLASSHIPLSAGQRPPVISGPSSGEYGGYGACESEMGRGVKGPRTSFVSLNFPDLRIVNGETIRRVAGGVDGLELRVDTLVQSTPDTPPGSRGVSPTGRLHSLPSRPTHQFVSLCFAHLRRCTPLPIMYTVRTKSKGGKFPDPWDDPVLLEEYLGLVELGFKLGAEYVDLETPLSDQTIIRLLNLRGAATQCIASDHDYDGEFGWEPVHSMQIYERAAKLGVDIVRLVRCPKSFRANLELLNFRESVAALDYGIPLTTLNLGKSGQLSRYLNPVFTLVTHPLLPGAAGPGQLTFAQHQQALYLSGLILEKIFYVPTSAVAELFSREATRLGLPFTFIVEDRIPSYPMEEYYGGSFLGHKAIPLTSVPDGDDVSVVARDSEFIDLIVPASTEPDTYDLPPASLEYFKHTNVRILALADVITQNLSPINAVGTHTCAILVGLSIKETKEAIEALRVVGAHSVFLFKCEGNTPEVSIASVNSTISFQKSQQPPSASGSETPPSIPYPQRPILKTYTLESFSSPILFAHRPPTILISSSRAPPLIATLFASSSGGVALDLSTGKGMLREALIGKGRDGKSIREGWHLLGPRDVEIEVEKQAFRALTGRRLA